MIDRDASQGNEEHGIFAAVASEDQEFGLQLPSGNCPKFAQVREFARGKWITLLTTLGIPHHHLGMRHGPCPICGGKDRFRFDDRDGSGSFFCNQCGPGDGFTLIQRFRGCSSRDSLLLVSTCLGLDNSGSERSLVPRSIEDSGSAKAQPRRSQEAAIKRIWEESVPVNQGDPVYRYLATTRRLALDSISDQLRFHPALIYREERTKIGTFPAMVAAMRDLDGNLVGIHRTYLSLNGQKAQVRQPKKMLGAHDGATRGAAVCLYKADDLLAVCEGIETALAVFKATSVPAWSAGTASGLASLQLPEGVKRVWVFADNDANETGLKAASKLAHRLLSEGRIVKLLLPNQIGRDFCDIFTGEDICNDNK